MTFKDVAIKNFLTHIRRYLSYFLCSSFTIMIFFIYSTMLFNESFMDTAKSYSFDSLMYLSIVTIMLFSVFFIIYAHDSFLKSRSSEFALFLSLGITKKNIGRMILIENAMIFLAAMVFGILSGALFSRLFFIIISELIKETSLTYELSYRSFLLTLGIFLLIYGTVLIKSRRSTLQLSIVKLFQKQRESTHSKFHLPVVILGLIFFFGATTMILLLAPRDDISDKAWLYLLYAAIAFPSMHIIISQGWSLYYYFRKKDKKRYYEHILSDNEIEYGISSNIKILFVLSLLSAMIIFFVASPISLYSLSENLSREQRFADIEYVQVENCNTIDQAILQQLLEQGNTPIKEQKVQEFLILTYQKEGKVIPKPVISQASYEKLNGTKVSVEEGEAVFIQSLTLPGQQEMVEQQEIMFYAGDMGTTFRLAGKASGKGINPKAFPAMSTLVINDADYEKIHAGINEGQIGKLHMFTFENWRKTGPVVTALENSLSNTSEYYAVDSLLSGYKESIHVFSMMIFFTSFMGVLFFISTGSILVFKQYGEMGHQKELYEKLSQIGLTKREFTRMYAASQRLIFFTPLVMGTFIGFTFMYLTTYVMGGGPMVEIFFRNAALVVILYFVIQSVFYRISLGRFRRNIFSGA